MERRSPGAPASSPACAAPSLAQTVSCPQPRMQRRPHGAPPSSPACAAHPVPQTVSCPQPRMQSRPPGAPVPWSAGVLAGLRRTVARSDSLMPAAPHAEPAPGSAGVLAGLRAHPVPAAVSCPQPRRPDGPVGPTDHARLWRWPVRTPALQNWRFLIYGAAAPWSAGVLAGLRRTVDPSDSLVPAAPHAAPAPWSAGVLAGLRAHPVPQTVSCPQPRRTDGPAGQEPNGPCAPLAVAGEDTGAPEPAAHGARQGEGRMTWSQRVMAWRVSAGRSSPSR